MIRVASLLLLGALAACSSTPDPLNTAGRPDGTPGNPPGTAASRANAGAGDPLNLQGRPDGTAGNPQGTAVSRALGTTDPAPARAGRRGTTRRVATTRRAVTPARARVGTTGGMTDVDPRTPNAPGQQPSGMQP